MMRRAQHINSGFDSTDLREKVYPYANKKTQTATIPLMPEASSAALPLPLPLPLPPFIRCTRNSSFSANSARCVARSRSSINASSR
jgi:hypothetical protein